MAITSTATEFFRAFVLWPIWWYSKGLVWGIDLAKRLTVYYARQMAVGIWVKNLFVPMFGLRDWQSRIISVFMRLLQIMLRSFGMLLWFLALLILVAAYLLAPIAVIGFLIFHFGGFL